MKVLGLLSPVGIRWVRKEIILPNALTVKGAYHLVYGLHRLAVARQLGWKEIPCQILFSSTAAVEDPHALKMQGQVRWLLDKCDWGAVAAGALRAAKSLSISSWIALS